MKFTNFFQHLHPAYKENQTKTPSGVMTSSSAQNIPSSGLASQNHTKAVPPSSLRLSSPASSRHHMPSPGTDSSLGDRSPGWSEGDQHSQGSSTATGGRGIGHSAFISD